MAVALALALQVGRREAAAPHRGASRRVRFCAALAAGLAPPPRPARPMPKAAPGRTQARQAESATAERTTPRAPAPGPAHIEAPATAAAPASAPLDLSDRVIRSAVAHSKGAVRQLAEGSGQELDTPRAGRDQQLANAAGQAGVPGCLRPDALKHDPPKIGPIPIPGIFAAPFVVHAAITGKCQP